MLTSDKMMGSARQILSACMNTNVGGFKAESDLMPSSSNGIPNAS